MDQKNRALFSIAVIGLIFAALLISFGRIFFNTHTPDVVLPPVGDSQQGGSNAPGQSGQDQQQLVSVTVQTWVDRDWTLVRQLLPSNAVRQDLIGPEQGYYWYEGSSRYESAPAVDRAADLAQHIPTYETVLALDPSSIVTAGYELKGDIPCVYVQSLDSGSRNVTHFWVSVDSGLLICAELYRENGLVYRMSALSPIQSPCPSDVRFALPDGTVLHEH